MLTFSGVNVERRSGVKIPRRLTPSQLPLPKNDHSFSWDDLEGANHPSHAFQMSASIDGRRFTAHHHHVLRRVVIALDLSSSCGGVDLTEIGIAQP